MSIHLLLSLRAARRQREQHFTSRRPGGTTAARPFRDAAGRLASALAAAALLALALAWSLQPLVHDDLFWHLRTGEWIAAHHRVPLVDLFSYTRFGARWITHEWLFSLASWLVYRAAGAAGLVVSTFLLAAGTFAAVAWRAVDLAGPEPDPVPGSSPAAGGARAAAVAPVAPAAVPDPAARIAAGPAAAVPGARARRLLLAALLALGLWAVSPELFLRAALAGELMLALVLAALTRYRRTGRRRFLWIAAGLFLPWANLHSGVLFGLFVLALYALEPLVARTGQAGARRRAAAPWLWTLAAALALTLLNPNGPAAPLYPLLLGRILFASGIPWELGHFSATAPAGGAANAPIWLLLVLLLLSLLPLRQARRLSAAEAASMGAFFVLTLVSHRFVFDLVVIALPTLYKLLVLPPGPAPAAAPVAESVAPPPPLAPVADSAAREADPGSASAPAAAAFGLPGLAGRPALAAALAALFVLPVGAAAVAGTAAGWTRRAPAAGGLIAEHFPRAAVSFIAAQGLAGPAGHVFNYQNWGGFLGWSLRVPVFWDGRNDVFAELVREVATQPFGLTGSRYHLDYLLIAEHDYPGIQPEIAAGRWGLVYWDDFAAVYLRRG
ncbi:MAG TPA: hypothetical protein VE075_01095, partial [Thermoanaerobaculia bacterium]|nr:hypothetical protein [Thermoanaerobaculia bacterium]